MEEHTSPRAFDVITIGDLCVDLIISGTEVTPRFGQVEKLVDGYLLELGGSCSIFACQAAKLGMRTGLLGKVGADVFGGLVIERLAGSGVDIQHVRTCPALKTGLGLHLCQGDDRAILTYLGSIGAVQPADVTDAFLMSARHMHFGSYYLHISLRAVVPQLFQRARALGVTISLDTNWDPGEQWQGLAEILPLVDVFLPNEQEAILIATALGAPASGLHEVLPFLLARMAPSGGARAPVVVVKRGAQGALAACEAETISCEVEPATGGDSIGAGDSFDAGFLTGWLRGLSLAQCLQIACACGRGVAGALGGLRGQPRWAEVAVP